MKSTSSSSSTTKDHVSILVYVLSILFDIYDDVDSETCHLGWLVVNRIIDKKIERFLKIYSLLHNFFYEKLKILPKVWDFYCKQFEECKFPLGTLNNFESLSTPCLGLNLFTENATMNQTQSFTLVDPFEEQSIISLNPRTLRLSKDA